MLRDYSHPVEVRIHKLPLPAVPGLVSFAPRAPQILMALVDLRHKKSSLFGCFFCRCMIKKDRVLTVAAAYSETASVNTKYTDRLTPR
jgi:hypothetical protein